MCTQERRFWVPKHGSLLRLSRSFRSARTMRSRRVHRTHMQRFHGAHSVSFFLFFFFNFEQHMFAKIVTYYGFSKKFKAADLQNILKNHQLQIFQNISSDIYNSCQKLKFIYFHFFALKTDNSLFCHHNGYCVSNAVDYTKKNDVLPTILSTELVVSSKRFLN